MYFSTLIPNHPTCYRAARLLSTFQFPSETKATTKPGVPRQRLLSRDELGFWVMVLE